MRKIEGPITPARRALAAQIALDFECEVDDQEGFVDGVEGGGHYAAWALRQGSSWVFEAVIVASPCWRGSGRTRRLDWSYALRLWTAEHSGAGAHKIDWAIPKELGEALMRCDAPAAVALACLPDPKKACAESREEMGVVMEALEIKASLSRSIRGKGVKRARPGL